MAIDIAFLLYPGVTQLDLTAPFEVFSRLKDANLALAWKTPGPVRSDSGLGLLPTHILSEVSHAQVVCIPGGAGQIELMQDSEVLAWIAQVGSRAQFVTSVCVGSFLLGAAGLLKGYRATSHWASVPLLAHYGAIPVEERVVIDRNRITGGGVTAGIDFALTLVEQLAGREAAESIQLALEYDPAPPMLSGHPRTARPEVTQRAREQFKGRILTRELQGQKYSESQGQAEQK
jgi:cyclohexyl-isocyanide hydratase